MNCPTCGGETWNNTEKVAGGWKGPLFKCKDQNCAWLKWPDKPKKNAPQGKAEPRAPKWTWGSLSVVYRKCLLLAEKHVIESSKRTKLAFTTGELLSAAATLFIAASRDGIQASQPPAPEPPPPQPLDEHPAVLATDEKDDLPW